MDESTTEKVYGARGCDEIAASEIGEPAVTVVVAAIVVIKIVVRSARGAVYRTVSVVVTLWVMGTKTVLGVHDAASALVKVSM